MNLNQLDKSLLNLKNHKDPLKKILKELEVYFENENLYKFCLNSSNDFFFKKTLNEYHNGIHTARVLKCLKEMIPLENIVEKSKIQLLVLAALFHDYEHKGRKNFSFAEQEKESFKRLAELLKENNIELSIEDLNLIEEMIVGTEESTNSIEVKNAYKEMITKNEYNINKVLKALLCEADIMSSILNHCGRENGLLLSKEFENEKINTDLGRLSFLNNIFFVTQAAEIMNINKYLIKERKKLNK